MLSASVCCQQLFKAKSQRIYVHTIHMHAMQVETMAAVAVCNRTSFACCQHASKSRLYTCPVLLLCCRRYVVPVKQQLVQGTNKVSISIKPATAESINLR